MRQRFFYSRRTGRSDGHPVRGWPFPQRGDGGAGEEYGHTIVRRRSGRGGCLPGGRGSGPGASGPARLHAGGPGRGGRARGPGAGLFGPAGLRVSPAALAHHREPGPCRTPQERDRLRPAPGPWPAGGQRADPGGSPAGPGLCRRAFPFRRAPAGARHAAPGHHGPAAGPRFRHPAAGQRRRGGCGPGRGGLHARASFPVRGLSAGAGRARSPAAPARASGGCRPVRHGFRRGPRPAGRAACAGSGGRRHAQFPHDRPARQRQEHAGPASAHHPAAPGL